MKAITTKQEIALIAILYLFVFVALSVWDTCNAVTLDPLTQTKQTVDEILNVLERPYS